MAMLKFAKKEDFLAAVQLNCNPGTHMAVTDRVSYVCMVPVVTSQHRHYIWLEAGEEDVQAVCKELEKRGFKVVEGLVELRVC